MNLLVAFKPMTVDDCCHLYFAARVVQDPLHPYEFEIPWNQIPQPAWNVMVPPVLSYYWAPAVAWFGDAPLAWHAWLLPLHFLFCRSLLTLLLRLIPRHAGPLLFGIALGPTILPGVNLMLEIPMLAFGLAGLALMLKSCDERHVGHAVLAGLLLGIAFQTKYSAISLLGPWVLSAALWRRTRELGASLLAAAAVVVCIEWALSISHGGGSYFLNQLEQASAPDPASILRGMFWQTGGLGPPAAMLAMWGMRVPQRVICTVSCILATAFVIVATAPSNPALAWRHLPPDRLAHLFMSATTWGAAAALYWRLARTPLQRAARAAVLSKTARTRLLLSGWFVSEIAFSLLMSPAPAARRCILTVMAMTFGAAWLATRTRRSAFGVRLACAFSILLGLVYQGVDYLEGRAAMLSASQAGTLAHQEASTGRVFFTGAWAFEYYAPRSNMAPLLRGRTDLHAGDLVVVGSLDGEDSGWFKAGENFALLHELANGDSIPLSLANNYYSGMHPLQGQSGPRYVARLYRAKVNLDARELYPAPSSARTRPSDD